MLIAEERGRSTVSASTLQRFATTALLSSSNFSLLSHPIRFRLTYDNRPLMPRLSTCSRFYIEGRRNHSRHAAHGG